MATDFQPYVGPRPYERNDQAPFFGRDREADELLSLIVSYRELLFYSQSGAGKTSLLNAKVIPLLIEEEGFEVLPLARVQGVIPKGIQLEEIQNLYVFNTLMSWAKDETNPRRLVQMTISEFLHERRRPTDDEGQPLPRALIFDQFEEIFILYQDRWDDRNEFFEQVCDALKDDNRLLRVIFSIREDYIAQLDPYAPLLPEKLRTRFRMERLRRDAALAAVVGPLRETKRSFAKGVAEKLVEDLLKTRVETITGETIEVTGEFVEPVQLQVVCQNLWQEIPPDITEITEMHLLAFGGVDRPLSRFYEGAVKAAVTETGIEEEELRQWCEKWLITSTGTRGIVHRGPQSTEGIPNKALDILEARHLINSEWRAGARWYELTHDRLIDPIRASNERWNKQRGEKANQASLLVRQAEQSITMQKYERALDASMKAYALSEEIDDLQGEGLALFYVGKAFEGQKKYDEALTTYAKALEVLKQADARDIEANLLESQGNLFVQMKKYKQAVNCFNAYIELIPDDPGGYYNLGRAYRNLNNYKRAIEDYNNALELDPKYVYAYNGRGNAYADLKQYKRAIEDYDRALEFDPTYVNAYNNRGNAYADLKEYKRAIEDYNRALELDPTYVSAYNIRGNAYAELKQYERAINDYDHALKLDSAHVKTYNNRGRTYYRLKQYERAIKDYNHALELDPKYTDAYNNRGLAYSNLKQYERAIKDYDRAIELDPTDVEIYNNRGQVHTDLREYEPAIADYNNAIELNPEKDETYLNRGYTYLWIRDIKQAQLDFMQSFRMDSKNVNYGLMAEWTTTCQEKPGPQTAGRMEAIASNNPNNAEAYICRGVALWIRERFEEAIAELNRAIPLNPKLEDIFFWKGMVHAYLGQDDEAMAALEKSLELDLPPLLLSPLRWTEQDRPDFYRKYAAPLLARYEM